MELRRTLKAQVARKLSYAAKAGSLYMPETVEAVVNRYSFVQFPKTLEEYSTPNGVIFAHGQFNGTRFSSPHQFTIDQFVVFEHGIMVETQTSTEEAEEFLEDLIAFAKESLSVSFFDLEPEIKVYCSQLELTCRVDLSKLMGPIDFLSKRIGGSLQRYQQDSHVYSFSGIVFDFDRAEATGVKPYNFTFERRAEHPYKNNVYFSQAPLTTQDHLELLAELEARLAG